MPGPVEPPHDGLLPPPLAAPAGSQELSQPPGQEASQDLAATVSRKSFQQAPATPACTASCAGPADGCACPVRRCCPQQPAEGPWCENVGVPVQQKRRKRRGVPLAKADKRVRQSLVRLCRSLHSPALPCMQVSASVLRLALLICGGPTLRITDSLAWPAACTCPELSRLLKSRRLQALAERFMQLHHRAQARVQD